MTRFAKLTSLSWLASLALALTMACTGQGEEYRAGTPPIDEGGPTGGGDSCGATTILAQKCGGCHSGSNAPQGLDLASSGVKGRLANVAARGCEGETLVVPGDAAGSYLLAKIDGTHAEGCGVQMPKGQPELDGTSRNCIADWITNMTTGSGGGGDGSGDDGSGDDGPPVGGGW